MQIFDEAGNKFLVASKIASGGEGTVYRLHGTDDYCVKIYHQNSPQSQSQQNKLSVLRHHANDLKSCAALPISLGFSDPYRRSFAGIFMPFSQGSDIYELYNPQGRWNHFKTANFEFIVRAGVNLSAAFESLHEKNIIVGDVNEQNIKVNRDATICIIDCDSFQISDGNKHYTCNVGTPLWTPPELQGIALTGLLRTKNHDAFGLAQLLFMLLFAGRNPFAGKPLNGRGMQPEEAIAKYAFAYDPDLTLCVQSPPPGAPSFSSIPNWMQNLFCRAFRQGSGLEGARPNSTEWREALMAFEKQLTRCGMSPSHVYWSGARPCPWCEVYHATGFDLFPTHAVAHYPKGNTLGQIVARLRLLRLLQPGIQLPPPQNIQVCALPQKPIGLWPGFVKSFSPKSWARMWLDPYIQKYNQKLAIAESTINQTHRAIADAYAKYLSVANPKLLEVKGIADILSNPDNLRQLKLNEVKSKRWDLELQHHLQGCSIRRSKIYGVGAGRTATLTAYGIVSAADISFQRIMKIEGFGRTITHELLKWRDACTNRFRFDANAELASYLIDRAESEYQNALKRSLDRAAILEREVADAESAYTGELRRLGATMTQATHVKEDAKANIANMEREIQQAK
jgi:DNA-binding helix-hairpin-helix protein with protein kinase domain